ncbi:hypothetical protein [Sulfurivirga caldicuralii]
MAKKHELGQLLAHLHSVGITSEVLKKHGVRRALCRA